MKIGTLNGFELHIPTSGGKAGKGCNETSTIQVRKNNCIVKQFRFRLGDDEHYSAQLKKAKAFILQ